MTTRSDHRREAFCVEYTKDFNASRAALAAGYSASDSKGTGYKLMQQPEVLERIAELMAERAERTKITTDDVVRELARIALTDHNELIEYRRTACRHCHGIEHRYQYTTPQALALAEYHFKKSHRALIEDFEHGGTGFNKNADPHPDCPECNGEGVERAYIKDTRHLSPAARSLYAGAKITKDGVELRAHSKEKALELLGRHLGMFTDKLEVNGDLAKAILDARNRSS